MSEVLPKFELIRPESVKEAVAALAREGAEIIAGGTDKVVQLRRGLATPGTLIDPTRIASLRGIERSEGGLRIGAAVTLAELADDPLVKPYASVAEAAASIAAPSHRAVATIGGNLCLDTRCLYYNQSHWWRKSNDFCLKYQGDTCHVAPKGNRCRAAFSGDLAPALMVHGATLEIAGPGGTRHLLLTDFYVEDGAAFLTLAPGELLVAIHLPAPVGPSAYAKVRLRKSIDFPLAGVALARSETGFSIALTGTNSCPKMVDFSAPFTKDDAYFNALEKAVQKAASPQRTSTTQPHYRRLSIAALAARTARALA